MSKPTLPLHIKTVWVEALRSGQYKQAAGTLYDPESDGYCCLGVLQKVLDGHIETYENGHPRAIPSREWCAQHKLGLGFWQFGNDTHEGLTDLNDHFVPFSEIADVIEREYEGV